MSDQDIADEFASYWSETVSSEAPMAREIISLLARARKEERETLAAKDREIASWKQKAMQAAELLELRTEAKDRALIEATAELIYLRQHGKDGAVWWANESKDVWRGKAIAALSMTAPPAPAIDDGTKEQDDGK